MAQLPSDLARILIAEEAIQARVKELANEISKDLRGVESLYLVGILKGAFIFLADLARQLQIPHSVDFMALSSYGKSTTSGAVRILMDLREPIEGRHVMIVEDILDTGQHQHRDQHDPHHQYTGQNRLIGIARKPPHNPRFFGFERQHQSQRHRRCHINPENLDRQNRKH